ncbi:hypothetical protein SAMN04487958_107209 [Vreelandella subterranea]|uniref:Uncharacterized protein n=1 Tax=Vreelandella subterranea TaxID=416874 RepID=A0A1H9UTJ8_9GAMM|nr:hypothetical protein [Halomonas subterranea]SES12678.1 hypothetical protein SAMN04487958_107209 [Halomonas subterranea]
MALRNVCPICGEDFDSFGAAVARTAQGVNRGHDCRKEWETARQASIDSKKEDGADVDGKRLSSCKLRYSEDAPPFRGLPDPGHS